MKQANAYQPFLFSSFKKLHSLTLGDLKWKAFERNDFLGDGEDWGMVIGNMLMEKNPALLAKLKLGTDHDMLCIQSEDKDALHEIAQMVFAFYSDDALLDAFIKRYAQYDFMPNQ
jgi:hypothetical protein